MIKNEDDPDLWEDDDWEDEIEGLDDLLMLAPFMPLHLLLPVMDRLGLSVREVLEQPWSRSQSLSFPILVEAILQNGDPDLIVRALRAAPILSLGVPERAAVWLNAHDDPRLVGAAAEAYVHSEATLAVRHALARGPLGWRVAEHLLNTDSEWPAHLIRPLLASGHPEIALRILEIPAAHVTRDEQAEAATRLLEQGRGAELERFLRSADGEVVPGEHITRELREAFSDGVPDGDDARTAPLRRAAEQAGTPAALGGLLEDKLDTAESHHFLLASPHLHDLGPLVGVPLSRWVRSRATALPGCPPEIGRSLLDHRDVAGEDDRVLTSPCQTTSVAEPEDVIRYTAPALRLVTMLDPSMDWKYYGYALYNYSREHGTRVRLIRALRDLLTDSSPEALLGGARLVPGFDGPLPELLAAGRASTEPQALTQAGIDLLHLLLHCAPTDIAQAVLAQVSAQEALALARHAALWLTADMAVHEDEDADLRPYRSLLYLIAQTRTDAAVRQALADAAVQSAGEAAMERAGTVLLAALEAAGAPGIREQAERHLPDAAAWLAAADTRAETAREAADPSEARLNDLLSEEPPARIWRPETPVAWDEVVAHYQGGGQLADEAVTILLHRPDLPVAMRPLLLAAHPELRDLPAKFQLRHPRLAPRWLFLEALPRWDRVTWGLHGLTAALTARLVTAEELIGMAAPAKDAAYALEQVQHVLSLEDLAPRCREVVAATCEGAEDVETWAVAISLLPDFPGTLRELLATTAAAHTEPLEG